MFHTADHSHIKLMYAKKNQPVREQFSTCQKRSQERQSDHMFWNRICTKKKRQNRKSSSIGMWHTHNGAETKHFSLAACHRDACCHIVCHWLNMCASLSRPGSINPLLVGLRCSFLLQHTSHQHSISQRAPDHPSGKDYGHANCSDYKSAHSVQPAASLLHAAGRPLPHFPSSLQ